MPALSSTTTWRTHPQRADWFAYISDPAIVFERRVNQSTFSYPVLQFAYDNPDANGGSASDVKPGMTVVIRSSAGVFKGFACIASIITSAPNIYIDAVPWGEIYFENNDIIQVLEDYRVWAKIPYISNDGTPFKRYNIGFAAASAQPPVAVISGGWYAKHLIGTTISISLSATESYTIANGATISSYIWSIGDGTITSGSLTSSSLTATFPAGERWIDLTVADSNGNSHTTHSLIVAATSTTALPIKMAQLAGGVQNGWECGFDLLSSDTSAYLPGTPVLVWADEMYGAIAGGLNGATNREHIKFVGYLNTDSTHIEALNNDWQVTAKNAQGVLADRIAFNQAVEYASSPTSWFQMANLTHWRYCHYLMQWHSTILDVTPVLRPDHYTTYPAIRLDSSEGSLNDQLQFMAQAVRARFTCDRNGICRFDYNPHFMTASERSAATITISLTDNDWTNAITLENSHYRDVAMVNGGGVIASSSTTTAILGTSPGVVPGQGRSQDALNNQLIVNAADLLSRIGRLYALKNVAIKGFSLSIVNQGQIADPAWGEIVRFSLNVASNRRGISFTNEPFVLANMDISFDHESGTTLENWTLETMCAANALPGVQVLLPGQTPDTITEEFIPSDGTWEDQPVENWSNYYPSIPVPLETTETTAEGIVISW